MNVKCECCGFEEEFASAEEAFHEGWDVPPYVVTTGRVVCTLCPSTVFVLPDQSHTKAHAYWAEHGRPKGFNSRCLPDLQWDWTQEELVQRIWEASLDFAEWVSLSQEELEDRLRQMPAHLREGLLERIEILKEGR